MGIIVKFASLLRLELPHSKKIGPTASARLRGAKVTLLPGSIRPGVSDESANALILTLRETIGPNRHPPSAAEKLRRGLGYAQSLLFPRFGRAMLQPYSRRQYSNLRNQPTLSAELRFAAKWTIRRIPDDAPRCAP